MLNYVPDSILTANILNIIKTDDDWRSNQIVGQCMADVDGIIRSLENKKRTFFIYQKLINLHKITLLDKFTIIFLHILYF